MTPEEHQAEHVRLDRALDQLIACWVTERSGLGGQPRASIYQSVLCLMEWSHEKTVLPSPIPEKLGQHDLGSQFLIAQNDDPELLEWLTNASQRGGGFVQSIANAGLRADAENYPLIRTLLLVMRQKYPRYEPSDAVKEEIRNRPKEPAR